jgi:hypothetical protein
MKKVKFLNSDFHKDPASKTWLCVEVARKGGQVAVRDSKNRKQPFLRFSNAEWRVFTDGVKAGRFDV